MRRLLGPCAALAVLLVPLRASADYLVTDLGIFTASGINNAGQVVGSSPFVGGALLYSGGTFTNLGNFDPIGINSSGQVLGFYFGNDGIHGVLSSGGALTDLGSLGSGAPGGINDAGQVVGYSHTASGQHAFLYSGGVMKDLGTLGGASSAAYAINASGQVVGWSDTTGGGRHTFLYTGGVMKDLSLSTPGLGYGIPTAINASGQVVGYTTTATGDVHAFLYSGGKMTDLGTLGGQSSLATGINASGQVVGFSDVVSPGGPYSPTGRHGFLYSSGKLIDLNDLLAPGSGITLTGGSINDLGQIVASASNGHSYLLTPDGLTAFPEPGSLTLLGLGAVGLLVCRRRWAHFNR